MDANSRACIAYIVASLAGQTKSSIYDFSQGKHISISGTVSDGHANIYDHDRGCHFSGSFGNLYDYGRSCHLSLSINGNSFKGYDYGDNDHFSGTVNGHSVSIYDFGAGQYFSYS